MYLTLPLDCVERINEARRDKSFLLIISPDPEPVRVIRVQDGDALAPFHRQVVLVLSWVGVEHDVAAWRVLKNVNNVKLIFSKMGHSQSLLLYFQSFQTAKQFWQQINVKFIYLVSSAGIQPIEPSIRFVAPQNVDIKSWYEPIWTAYWSYDRSSFLIDTKESLNTFQIEDREFKNKQTSMVA